MDKREFMDNCKKREKVIGGRYIDKVCLRNILFGLNILGKWYGIVFVLRGECNLYVECCN